MSVSIQENVFHLLADPPSGIQHLDLHLVSLETYLRRVGTSGILFVLNLCLERPDHTEEVSAEDPGDDAADSVGVREAEDGLEDVEDVQDEADSGEDDPGHHQRDIVL